MAPTSTPTSTSAPVLGVLLPRDLPAGEVVAYAQAAERHGFDELWVVEDCFYRGGISQAAVVLATTTSIRVGIGILPAAARSPVFTALETSTLAELFPGRLLVGVGHGMPGWMRQVGAWPASPLAMLEEHLSTLRALLRGERLTVAGRYVTLDDVALDRPPAVVPPVLAGVRGPRSLALAGRCADGTILAEPVTPEYLAAARAQIAAGQAGGAGDGAGPGAGPGAGAPHTVVAYAVAAVDDDPARARDLARGALEWIGEPDWAPHLAPLPFAAEFARLRRGAPSRAAFAAALPDAWVDQLAIVGTPSTAGARAAELHRAGADTIVLIPVGADPHAALASLARLVPAEATNGLNRRDI
ncbi:LLM class flavin-dependent oxidoreductase [Pengzhenrongella sicca]|uniref:LLM class flavin-dependent oxidoreductase n=1 Tax=Pengzhenrongella sicca TaxID=2819238 RepID=A0A8A4ZJY7_9MICO|nr:LLM class flavin-dependent oxidoreductase [Pengzhenrongella sicca]QTE30826.1 LLM class flavin-dependent oxidoreductase [Pengzhenrongella sicca]